MADTGILISDSWTPVGEGGAWLGRRLPGFSLSLGGPYSLLGCGGWGMGFSYEERDGFQ